MHKILICDDDRDIVNALKLYLADPDYCFYEAYDGEQAVEIVNNEKIDLILLDIMMPKTDGIKAMSLIREKHNIPVILLTAKSEESDIVLGLNVGADDYITKPFNPIEVGARVKAQLRRYLYLGSKEKSDDVIMIGGIELDDRSKKVTADGKEISLTPKEYEILKLLMKEQGRVFSPKEIYNTIWKEPCYGGENTVAVHIRHLREKIEIDPTKPRYIKVVFGQGYCFERRILA